MWIQSLHSNKQFALQICSLSLHLRSSSSCLIRIHIIHFNEFQYEERFKGDGNVKFAPFICLLYLLLLAAFCTFSLKRNIQQHMLKSIKLTQHQERLPDTPGESRVSVLIQTFRKVWVLCQTVHSDFTLLVVWSTAVMNLKLLFFFLFLAVLLTPAEVCILCIYCTEIVWQ